MKHPLRYDPSTLEFYQDEAPVYAASGIGGVSRFLPSFMERLPNRATVLDLGCGGGRDSEAMIANGFHVEAWDGSAKIALQAQARIHQTVIVKRFDELGYVERFDAIWASASLLHVPKATLPEVLEKVHRALKPGGQHFASYKSGGQEGRDENGRYFNYLSKNQLLDAYATSGEWEISEIHEYQGGGYNAKKLGPWIALFATKPST